MPLSLVECVPNFSEARRPEVVEAIQEAITAVPGIQVLDRNSDMDHNRSVITFVGSPKDVEEAAYQAIAKAAELIDLNQHSGEHPRIGAADVVPFVPISGITIEECVEIARRLGSRVGETLQIPVYLYERAATRPERQNLEDIRRGQYEGLKEEIASNPEREPDFGPARLGPAGATVIGARPFLIAFNVYLTSQDVNIAKKIARTIRHSSGGLRYVKALGLSVEGRAQVSMNLTDFQKTPMAQVVEMIRREAQRYGVAIHHSELVGMIPQAALTEAAVWYMQLDQFEPHQILERRLEELSKENQNQPTRSDFLDALADATPTPGGGSASAYAAASAAALVCMVARLTIGKKAYAQVEGEMEQVLQKAEALRVSLRDAVEQDAKAFNAVMAAFKMPKSTSSEKTVRDQAIEKTTLGAAMVPLQVAGQAVEVMELAVQVVAHGNLNAISDGASAAALAQAALRSAGYNVKINAASLSDKPTAKDLVEKIDALETSATLLDQEIISNLKDRGGLSLG
jgi:glutamate formiminotransferase/formiminotetrahydrofolate cyclodeaminase